MYFTPPNQAIETSILNLLEQIKPQYHSPLEWWYLHGNLQSPDNQSISFMFSIFRNQFSDSNDHCNQGYQVILSINGSAPEYNWKQSQIDPVFYNGILNNNAVAESSNIDLDTTNFFFEMAEKEGPPRPIILKKTSPEIYDTPFQFIWDAFEIRADASQIHCSFINPEIGLDISFDCCVADPLLNLFDNEPTKEGSHGMSYLTQTRLPISGKLNQQPIKGTAWLDHQWGVYEWLFDPQDQRLIRGWNWFGINLEDGSDLVLLQHIESESKKVIDSFATCICGNQMIRTGTLTLEPLTEWFSHKTESLFPISMKILIPEFEAELVFTPLLEDQEISIFGPMRSVWQGAGTVSGHIKGRMITGVARCELAGYAFIHNLKDHFSKFSSRIDRSIASFFPIQPDTESLSMYLGDPYWAHEPAVVEEMISKPVWDLMNRSGKRWRPLFAYYLLKALNTDPEPYEQAIFALAELIHTGSLIIDDIQDGSLTRRGDDSIHLRYGQDLAITAGNTLYFLPSLLIMDHPVLTKDQKHQITDLMNRHLIKAHFGQSMDLYWSKHYSLNGLNPCEDQAILERIKQIYALKTGAPIQGLAEAAAIISGTSHETQSMCGDYAQKLGVAFQIIDDINNFDESGKWGKLPGEDLKEGKVTFVIAWCLKNLGPEDRRYLLDLIKSPALRSDREKLSEGIKLVRNSGSFEACRNIAHTLVEESWSQFSKHLAPSDAKIFIRALADYLIKPLTF